jgi:hypothetical protein
MAEAALRPRKWCLITAGILQFACALLLLPLAMQFIGFDRWGWVPNPIGTAVVAMLAEAVLTVLGNRWAWALSLVDNVILFALGAWTANSRSSGPATSVAGAVAAGVAILCIELLWRGRSALAVERSRARSRVTAFVLIGGVALAFAIRPLSRKFVTGSWTPIEYVEKLSHPVNVVRWSDTALILSDGRQVPLRGIAQLPRESKALTAATSEGVEVTPDGAVIGLLPIHHWCGNDPVRRHIARVDIAQLLLFLGEGEPQSGPKADRGNPFFFTKWGWDASEYYAFQLKTDPRGGRR